jgi:CheY-like chemotaxis protein
MENNVKRRESNVSVNETILSENFQDDVLAENCGRTRILNQLLDKMEQLAAFIEVELEDHPAEEYLEEFSDVLQQAKSFSRSLPQNRMIASAERKDVKLNDLLQEVVRRHEKIGSSSMSLELAAEQDYFISAIPSQLSTACFALLNHKNDLFLKVENVTLNSSQRDFNKSGLPDGQYWGVVASADEQADRDLFKGASTLVLNDDESEKLAAYGVILSHGGDVLVHPSSAAFMVILPQSQATPIVNQDDAASDLRGQETILVVDDEDMIWDILIENLQELDYTVLLAENGAEAVEIYRENPGMIDIVILDMVMPVMNGREAFAALKELDPQIKVILSSGYMAESDASDVLQGGAKAFLHKPYRMTELAKTIRGLV